MLEVKKFKTLVSGPVVGFIGGIHGNETCGVKAINKIINEIERGDIVLKSGDLCFMPLSNPRAYEQGVRYCDVNLNRIFKKIENPKLYEETIVGEVMSFIDGCDVIVDLHSNHTSGVPFIFQDEVNPKTTDLIEALPVSSVMRGWAELYSKTEDVSSQDYACKKGKCALTIECGEHDDPKSVDIAFNCIIATLKHFNMIESINTIKAEKQYMFLNSFTLMPKGGVFVKNWMHGDKIHKDEKIGTDFEGKVYKSDIDGFICLPFSAAEEGGEWFYLAT